MFYTMFFTYRSISCLPCFAAIALHGVNRKRQEIFHKMIGIKIREFTLVFSHAVKVSAGGTHLLIELQSKES